MKSKILNSPFLIFLIIPLFEPKIFVKIPLINYCFTGLSVVLLFFLILLYYRNNHHIPIKLLGLFLLFRIFMLIPSILGDGDILSWGYLTIVVVDMILLFMLFRKNNLSILINALDIVIILYLLINITSYLLTDGLYIGENGDHLYFLGIRTRFGEYAITGITLSILNFRQHNKKIRLIIEVSIAALNVIIPWVVTAIMVVLFSLALLSVYYLIRVKKTRVFSLSLILTAFTIFFILFDGYKLFGDLFVLFGKDPTLTNRTLLWEKGREIIKTNIVFGFGNKNDGNFIFNNGRYWQAHNTILQLLYEGGILATISFYIMMLSCTYGVSKIKDINVCIILSSFILGFMVGTISEIYYYYSVFYVPIVLVFAYLNFPRGEIYGEE